MLGHSLQNVVPSPTANGRRSGGSVNRSFWVIAGTLCVAGVIVNGYVLSKRRRAESQFAEQVALAKAESDRIRAEVVLPSIRKMPARENFAGALQSFGLSPAEVNDATTAAKHAFNFRQLRAGNSITVGRSVEGTQIGRAHV